MEMQCLSVRDSYASPPSSPVRSEDSTSSESDPHASSSSSSDSDKPSSPTYQYDQEPTQYEPHASVSVDPPRARAATTFANRTRGQSTASSLSQGRMREAVMQASEHSCSILRRESIKASSVPIQLKHVRLVDRKNDIALYQYKTRRSKEGAVQPPSGKPEEAKTTRIVGITQLHAPMSEVIKVIGHKSALSFALLNPGLADYQLLHTLVLEPRHYIAIKSQTMSDQWNSAYISRRREFIVMESQQGFQTDDGRKGWVVSYHSLVYSACPEPPVGAVRGSVYYSGIVALETSPGSEKIDLISVAEYNLKGQVTDRVNRVAARERVMDTLVLLTGTIEQRAVTELSLLQSRDFNEIKRLVQLDVCRICVEKIGVVPRRVRTHRCRKCCVSVCEGCSSIWRRGKKEMRLCSECWAGTTMLF